MLPVGILFWDLRQIHESAVLHLILHSDCTVFLLLYTHSVYVCVCVYKIEGLPEKNVDPDEE